ncbi:MAG: hypothetical protein AB7D57_02165 [Desulfovibrionaceae bacterium]
MQSQDAINWGLFLGERKHIKERLGNETWIIAYQSSICKEQHLAWYCGLINSERVSSALQTANWELMIGDGFPGCCQTTVAQTSTVKYDRFGFSDAEPLVFLRDFNGFAENYPDLNEEFRFFHNLYYNKKSNEYVKFDHSGEPYPVVRFDGGTVLIRLREIRQFLSVKEAHLAIYFDHTRWSNIDVDSIPENARRDSHKDDMTYYEFMISSDLYDLDGYTAISSIIGKKFIPPFPKSKSGIWPYNTTEGKSFEDFIIKEDSEGRPIKHSCDPSILANLFGANENAPSYLTPVHFKREVLQKYYGNPERYSVADGILRCGTLWMIRIDNQREDVVIVFLGDLGRDLPVSEQTYWKAFNISPVGNLSETQYRRSFMAEFCDPEGKDLLFKQKYQQLNTAWEQANGWALFHQLEEGDAHFFQNLRLPLTNSQSELDSQLLALTKSTIDSLNEKEISARIEKSPSDAKGIMKFSIFLHDNGFTDYQDGIDTLKLIQGLRSTGVAHLKGSNYEKLSARSGLNDQEFIPFFAAILDALIHFMDNLRHQLGSRKR